MFWGGFREEYFLGYDEIVDIFLGHHNWTFFFGGGDGVINIIYILFRAFSKGQSSKLEDAIC